MDILQKEKICNYLYGDEAARRFVCNDLFQEISMLIDNSECIHWKNRIEANRIRNKKRVEMKITLFLKENRNYLNRLDELYDKMLISDVMNLLLVGYVFYLSQTVDQFKKINIFKNKKSICYSADPTIFDVAADLT